MGSVSACWRRDVGRVLGYYLLLQKVKGNFLHFTLIQFAPRSIQNSFIKARLVFSRFKFSIINELSPKSSSYLPSPQ